MDILKQNKIVLICYVLNKVLYFLINKWQSINQVNKQQFLKAILINVVSPTYLQLYLLTDAMAMYKINGI